MNIKQEVAEQLGKAAPPVAVVTASALSSWTIGDTVGLLTGIYLVIQIAYTAYRWSEMRRLKRENAAAFAKKLMGED